jgi:hypothetical protein
VRASRTSSELRLTTRAVPVRLALIGGAPSPAELFVPDVPRRGHGQLLDDVAALLTAPTAFLPVRVAHRVRLFGKHAIAWIAVLRHGEDDAQVAAEPSEELTLYDREHIVELELEHATKLIGTLLDSAPIDRTRVIDHLNGAGGFLRLWTADEHYLVNTRQIIAVTELGGERI